MTITTTTSLDSGGDGRYAFDTGLPAHYAQLDTTEDASYYGNWASPVDLTLISYAEGDITKTVCSSAEEFALEIQRFIDFCSRVGYGFAGIDPGWLHSEERIGPWKAVGLAHLIH